MNVLRSYLPPVALAATGNQLLVAHGYQEAESALKMVMTDDPHNGWCVGPCRRARHAPHTHAHAYAVSTTPCTDHARCPLPALAAGPTTTSLPHTRYFLGHADVTAAFIFAASDGIRGYFAHPGSCTLNTSKAATVPTCNVGANEGSGSFVVALELNSRDYCEHNFTRGDGAQGRCSADGQWARNARLSPPEQSTSCVGTDAGFSDAMCHGDGNFCFDGCTSHGEQWSSGADKSASNAALLNATGQPVLPPTLADAITGLAVERADARSKWLFVAHGHRNEIRVLDSITGELNNTIKSLNPGALANYKHNQMGEASALWVIEDANSTNAGAAGPSRVVRKYTSTFAQWHQGVFVRTEQTLPGVGHPLSVTTIQCGWLQRGVHPACGGGFGNNSVAVSDGATQQVFIFDQSGKLLQTIGQPGGHDDGNPRIRDDVFYWRSLDGGFGSMVLGGALAADDDGGLWVADNGNRRLMRFNASTGQLVGTPLQYATSSYNAVVSMSDPTRLFSNYLEYSINYSVPLTDPGAWTLTNNWAAGTGRWPAAGFDGMEAVVDVKTSAGSRTFAFINPRASASSSPLPAGQQLVELVPGRGIVVVLNQSQLCNHTKFNFKLERDGSVRYMTQAVSNPKAPEPEQITTQSFYTIPPKPATGLASPWSYANCHTATLLANITGKRTTLLSRYVISGGAGYPTDANGNLIVFDGSTARLWAGEPTPDYVNRGFHLGGYRLDGSDKWAWQASPWGLWDLALGEPEVFGDALVSDGSGRKCKGYLVQQQLIDPRTKDGRYGSNDTGIQYAGNRLMVLGSDVMFGFHGEFWKGSEANQFLHFNNGLFIGQFGTPNRNYDILCGTGSGSQALVEMGVPGKAGNALSPSLTEHGGVLYLYHNDEGNHGGVHRWHVEGKGTIVQLPAAQWRDEL